MAIIHVIDFRAMREHDICGETERGISGIFLLIAGNLCPGVQLILATFPRTRWTDRAAGLSIRLRAGPRMELSSGPRPKARQVFLPLTRPDDRAIISPLAARRSPFRYLCLRLFWPKEAFCIGTFNHISIAVYFSSPQLAPQNRYDSLMQMWRVPKYYARFN